MNSLNEQTKTCNKCNFTKNISLFSNYCHSKDGKKGECKACCYEYSKAWKLKNPTYHNERNKKKALEHKLKAIEIFGGCCQICDGKFHHASMDFHHLDETTKEKSIGDIMDNSWNALIKELKKCLLVCSNCHRFIHYTLNNNKEMKDFVNNIHKEDLEKAKQYLTWLIERV